MLKHNLRAGRRAAGGTYAGQQAGSLSYGRLQAVAVDRAMGEEEAFERLRARRAHRT